MRKSSLFVCTLFMILLCSTTQSQNRKEKKEARKEAQREKKEKENEKYDNPMERDRQAAEMIKDPALGYVPYNRLLSAIDQTINLKTATRPVRDPSINLLGDPLVWEERGPIYDSVGPSNGNGRGGGTGSTAGGHTSGRIRGFLLDTLNDPTGNTAFTGGVGGGLWKCTNFLSTINNWAPVNDRFTNLSISSICQDPTNPLNIYFSTGEPADNADRVVGAGVWKSTDGGITFNALPATANFMRCFKVGCDAAGNVYLACRTTTVPVNQQSGLFRSTNGGTTWTDITPNNLDVNSSASCTDFEFTASGILNAMFGYRPLGNVVNHRYTSNPTTVTPSTWSTSTGFRPTNAPAIRTELAVLGEILYAVTINPAYNTDSCYKSIDGGVTWTKQNTTVLPGGLGNGQGWYSMSLAINPLNSNELISGGLDAYRSVNSGATWTRFTNWVSTAPYVHADHHFAMYWIAGGQTRMIMATDGGIFYSNDNGATFSSKNRNLGIKQFYAGAIHPAAGSPVLLAGAQDNGTHQLRNAGLSYSIEVTGGDGCIVHINQQNPLIQFGSYVYNQYRRTTNGGNTWSSVNLSASQGLFVNPFDHDDGQNIMYCSNGPLGQMRRWTNTNTSNTNSVITISNIGGATSLTSLKLSPYTANRLFFGTNTGKVYRLENANTVTTATANAALTDISSPSFPVGTIICVNVGTDDNNIIATYSNYGVNNVWLTTDGGANWSPIDGNLPDMPVRWAMFQPGTNRKIFLATEAGIYTTINANGASTLWLPETNFPTVSTYMLKMRASDSTIVAATHGRGLWTAKVAPCIPSQIDTQPVNGTFCAGSNATFTVVASGAILSYQWQVSTDGGTTFNDIPAANSATLTVPAVTVAMTGYQYRCNIDTDCSGVLTTITVTLTVNPTPTVDAIPNQTLCQGQPTAPVNFTGTPVGVAFQWTNSNTAIGLAASGLGNIPSFITTNNTAAPITGTITVTPVTGLNGPVTTTFNYTGAVQTFTVPAGITSVNIKAWGAQGNSNALNVVGGLGGYAEGTLAVVGGQTLFVYTGGGATSTINGGFNGGGAAGINSGCASAQGGGGGGASDVRTVNTLAGRILVAGGGGGAGANRVAGCGRGTGGGGGGGYYGGGGGAGWPGPPGTEGPVPTGGTQAAGGAGGITTFSPGPTNGFPGALGVGGAGGTEIGSNQGGSATAESGGVGGGLVGANGLYNNVNNWCGQSGAGGSSYIGGVSAGLTTPGLRTGNGLVTITYTPPSATTCFGTPRTFTITVNPNPSLVIVADPGSTLCQGDPALLTVRVGTSSPIGVLYNQPGVAGNGSPSQVFEPANTPFNSQSADDFVVPAGTVWTVTRVTADGIGAGVPTSLNVFFYNNSASNLPGTVVASYNNVATFTQVGGNYNVTLPSGLVLGAGTYWVSVQVNMSFATGGQWFWGNFGAANILNQYAWQNPGGGFGTPCTSWGYGATGCNVGGGVNRNNIFSIVGSSLADGGPLPPGYTFLWSPAAGLSSTTTNPVAASPATTTTYTVNVTTGQGCTNQASILMTVNLRPTITSQPASRTNCVGTTATFTVTGTGTTLAYQWQLSTTGAGGPWTNLTNAAPYSGVNTATLTINPVALAMNTYQYRCVLTGVCAPIGTANISNPAVLTVNPLPVVTVTPTVSCGSSLGSCNAITASGADIYIWSPATGLYLNCQLTIPYVAGSNAATVYAAPTAFTVYTVTGSLSATGCSNTATAIVNYTPPAPTVTPSSVAMCLGDAAVRLISSSASTSSLQVCSGPISVIVPDANAAGAISNLTVSGIPAACNVSAMSVSWNMNHTWDGDMVFALKAPNGAILNLDYYLSNTGGTGATTGFVNTTVSSAGVAALSSGSGTYTGTFKADALNAGIGGTGGPTGYTPTVTTWAPLYANPNGTWTLAMKDGFGGDQGTLTSWCLNFTYVCGVPSTPAVWSPIAGLFNDAAATIPYLGTPRDTVWTRPTPSGVYNYTVTVQSLPPPPITFTNPAPITVTDNAPSNPSPANLVVSGLPTAGVAVSNVSINGFSHTWSGDVNIVLQNPAGTQNVILKGNSAGGDPLVVANGVNLVFSDAAAGSLPTTSPMASGTYKPTNYNPSPFSFLAPGPAGVVTPVFPASPLLSTFTGNMNGTWKLYVEDRVGGDAGSISGGYSIGFALTAAACTSPARTVVVTVNQPTTFATQPVSTAVCTDKVATFTVVAAGSGPFSYQWQVSTDNGNTYSNISNGGVYAGATTATLTVTAPPVSMNGYQYRCVITGAAPCASATSFQAKLTVNPLPTIVISASPYTSLFPGLRTTLSSTVSPVAAAQYTWLRNGSPVAGATTGTLGVDVDGLGDYTLRVTDVNGCTNTSNQVTIKDSVSGKCFIYPNPSSGQFQVRYYSTANAVLPRSLTVYDAKGSRVITQYFTIGRPYDRMDVDMRKYGKGLYWVEIGDVNGSRLTMCRLVIE